MGSRDRSRMRAALSKGILFVFSQQIKLLIRQWVVGSDVAVANRVVTRARTMIRLRYYRHILLCTLELKAQRLWYSLYIPHSQRRRGFQHWIEKKAALETFLTSTNGYSCPDIGLEAVVDCWKITGREKAKTGLSSKVCPFNIGVSVTKQLLQQQKSNLIRYGVERLGDFNVLATHNMSIWVMVIYLYYNC